MYPPHEGTDTEKHLLYSLYAGLERVPPVIDQLNYNIRLKVDTNSGLKASVSIFGLGVVVVILGLAP